MNKRWMNIRATLVTGTLLLSGCATDDYGNKRAMTETEKGLAIGALTGAAAGALIADKSGKGAALGAAGGALVGGLIGNYMEQQRRDFERLLAPEIASRVIRVEKLPGDRLLVGMTGETAFEVDSDQIQPGFYSTMDKISGVVNKYGKTKLSIAGHTDSTGSATHNQELSERRAESVREYLLNDNVYPARLSAAGFGKNRPIASNDSEDGKRQNRRVDITIIPVAEES